MKPYNDLLSVFSLVRTHPVSNDNTTQMGVIVIIAIIFCQKLCFYFTKGACLLKCWDLFFIRTSTRSFIVRANTLSPLFPCLLLAVIHWAWPEVSSVYIKHIHHFFADPWKGGPCATDLLRQWPEGRGLWDFLDIQSCCCHQNRPLWLRCQQRLWRYDWTSNDSSFFLLFSVIYFVILWFCTLCMIRTAVSVAEKTLWDTRVRRHHWGAGQGRSQRRPG